MIKIKPILFLLLFVISNSILAQTNYYKMPNGIIVNEDAFNKQRTDMIETGNINVDIDLVAITRNDSVIKVVKFTFLDALAKHKKKIGTAFTIQKFKHKEG